MTHDLVVFGEDWGRFPTSTQHLVQRLPTARKILYVNSVGLRRPRLGLKDMSRLGDKLLQYRKQRHSAGDDRLAVPDGMTIVAPLVIPWPASDLAFKINRRLLARQLRQKMAEEGIERPILWISIPTAFAVAGMLDERALVYYCPDDYGALDGVDNVPVQRIERRLVERADLVLACSEELVRRFPPSKTVLLPHGVDVARFSTPAARASDLGTTRPIAGFYGSFLGRIDVALLHKAATSMAAWDFVFVGDISQQEAGPLWGLRNVRFLGRRPHHELPTYVQHWTVSLLPFLDCAMVKAMNPLKLREYLAAGTPIAATEFPALAPYRQLVHVAGAGHSLKDAILAAQSDSARNSLRRESVAEETWEFRAKQADDALRRL